MDSNNLTLRQLQHQEPNNSFGIIRLVLALSVVFSHSFPIALDGTNDHEPLFSVCGITIGSLAVNCFMVISGFLVSKSFVSSSSLFGFYKKRFLRVYPAFIVLSVIQAFFVAPLVSNDLNKFYGINQLFLIGYNTFCLTSYGFPFGGLLHCFPDNPVPLEMNASLWTIRYEVWCYIFLPFLFLTRFSKQICLIGLVFFGFIIFFDIQIPWNRGLTAIFGAKAEWPRLAYFFLAGTCFFLFDKVFLNKNACLFFLIFFFFVIAVACKASWLKYIQYLFLPYLVLFLCSLPSPFSLRGLDLSYGVYLYGFLIGQILIYYFPSSFIGCPVFLFFWTALISVIVAFFSWNFIEKPALSFKK